MAMLAELARNQGDHRHEIVRHGGIEPMVELLCKGTPAAQKYAACAIWGISQESQHRRLIAEMRGAIAQLVDLLRQLEGETQGFAASTLVCMAQDKVGKETILGVGGAGPLMTIALGPTSWLRMPNCLRAACCLPRAPHRPQTNGRPGSHRSAATGGGSCR